MRPALMFDGRAEEAISFYVSLFEDGEVLEVVRDRASGGRSVLHGVFRIAGQTLLCSDASANSFRFTPAISLSIDCDSEEEIARLSEALSGGGGEVLIPSDDYGFSKKFTWITDRFGLTWQLNLP